MLVHAESRSVFDSRQAVLLTAEINAVLLIFAGELYTCSICWTYWFVCCAQFDVYDTSYFEFRTSWLATSTYTTVNLWMLVVDSIAAKSHSWAIARLRGWHVLFFKEASVRATKIEVADIWFNCGKQNAYAPYVISDRRVQPIFLAYAVVLFVLFVKTSKWARSAGRHFNKSVLW